MLYGRDRELDQIRRAMANAAAGGSTSILFRGAPGSGKSALLDAAAGFAPDSALVLRVRGVESEMEVPFAGLQLLLGSVAHRVHDLPGPQSTALATALGISGSGRVDRFQVGLAVITLLSELADSRPVVCLADDVQWLDRASADALFFAARRLEAESVVVVAAAREELTAQGVRELTLGPLDRHSAGALLDDRRPELRGSTRERIVREADGNPLALLALPEWHNPSIAPLPLPRRLQQVFANEIAGLPSATQLLLLIVVAADSDSLTTVLRAVAAINLSPAASTPAEQAGLIEVTDDTVRFRHPLIRAAAYGGQPLVERLSVHRALADVASDDRRAWHLAAAATGPDESVAALLQGAADQARRRGGSMAAAVAYERAAQLSTDESLRAARMVAAADAAHTAGRLSYAAELADEAARINPRADTRVQLTEIQAEAAFETGHSGQASELLINEAERTAALDPERAACLLLSATRFGYLGGGRMNQHAILAGAIASALPPGHALGHLVRIASNIAAERTGAALTGSPGFEEAQRALAQMPGRLQHRLDAAFLVDLTFGRPEYLDTAAVLTGDCRRTGAIALLPQALLLQSEVELSLGRWRAGYAHAEEGLRIANETGQQHTGSWLRVTVAWAAAVTGDESRAVALARECLTGDSATGTGWVGLRATRVMCLLDLGLGRYEAALDRMDALIGLRPALAGDFAPERIEAATRLGQLHRATAINDLPAAGDHPAQAAIVQRCRAMLSTDQAEADRLFRQALESHAALSWPFDHARTELLYGEWLRRQRRKHDARTHLRTAANAFDRMDARPWAERAQRELEASGDSSARATARPIHEPLTPQELQVTLLAQSGLTNREIAARLFLSPKTVGHHLYRAFPKLGVSTRTELARLDLE